MISDINKGVVYEYDTASALRNYIIENNIQDVEVSKLDYNGFNSWIPDLQLVVKHNFEIKLNGTAQMGSGSIRFTPYELSPFKRFKIANTENSFVDTDTSQMILDEVSQRETELQNILDFIKAEKIPFVTSKQKWEKLVDKGLLKRVNLSIPHNADYICNFYRQKSTEYIQIGKQGLFHLGKNPLKLPIPKLEGDINIEVRLTRSGSKYRAKYNDEMVGGLLRFSARLTCTDATSPITFDTQDGVSNFFKHLKNNK